MSAEDWKARVNKIRVQKERLKSRNTTEPGDYLVEKAKVSTDTVEKEGSVESIPCNVLQ